MSLLSKIKKWLSPDKPPKPSKKTYVFMTREYPRVGEWNRYSIEADSREEAEAILIRHFFGYPITVEDLTRPKSEHGCIIMAGPEVVCSRDDMFGGFMGQRDRFARLLHGMGDKSDREWLKKRMRELNIPSRD